MRIPNEILLDKSGHLIEGREDGKQAITYAESIPALHLPIAALVSLSGSSIGLRLFAGLWIPAMAQEWESQYGQV